MKNVIHKIFLGTIDEEVHADFIKFSRGLFKDRYLIEVKKQKDKWSVKTSSEFANFFSRSFLEKVKGDIEVKGAIISTLDMKKDIDFEIENVKNYMGIKQILINTKVDSSKLLNLMDKYPRAFYALTFSGKDFELKTKAKPPKSGKPGNKGEDEPKADFCALKTNNREIIEDLIFDFKDAQEVKVKHELEIKEIEIPKGVNDPKILREQAKRKGIIRRFSNANGKKVVEEKHFSA